MIARIRTRLTNRSGQSLVEFALVLPLLLILILGIVDFGLAYNYKNDETHLANEAARFAVVNTCSPCGAQSIEDFVKSDADSGDLTNGGGQIASPGVEITFCFEQPVSSPPGQVGSALRAIVKADYQFLPILNTQLQLVSTATQRIEQAYDSNVLANNAYGKSAIPPTCP
jgi:hypothetical protein